MLNKLVSIKKIKIAYEERIAEIQEDYEKRATDNLAAKQQLAQELVQYRGRVEGLNHAIKVLEDGTNDRRQEKDTVSKGKGV